MKTQQHSPKCLLEKIFSEKKDEENEAEEIDNFENIELDNQDSLLESDNLPLSNTNIGNNLR